MAYIWLMWDMQGNLLDNPKTEKIDRDEVVSESTGLCVGAAGMQGWRLEMEVVSIASYVHYLIFF